MGWFIAGLLILLLIGSLIGFGRARERDRQPADDTLLAELLGEEVTPPPPPAAPATQTCADGTVILATDACPAAPPPPAPPPATNGERG